MATGTQIHTRPMPRTAAVHYPDRRHLVVFYNRRDEQIINLIAKTLGTSYHFIKHPTELDDTQENSAILHDDAVLGVPLELAGAILQHPRRHEFLIINTYCIGSTPNGPDPAVTDACEFEFIYVQSPLLRHDLTKFLSHILGHTDFHEQLEKKARTYLISTTFPDVRAALSNLDILTVGADTIELRVDLLRERLPDGSYTNLPSIKYVGEQLTYLRQRSELPIIYTTRCTNENGKFPMDDPQLFYTYLRRAIQWGVEYIDIELWLPEEIRFRLRDMKGHSRIMSAYHDFAAALKWDSPEAHRLFQEGARFGEIVKMNKCIRSPAENAALQLFRAQIESDPRNPIFTAVNMERMGQLSRTLNTNFSPVTHPLLPTVAAPGQMSTAEINRTLHVMGQLPGKNFYAIVGQQPFYQPKFFERCFNELGLPHRFAYVPKQSIASVEALVQQHDFGGAFFNPALAASKPYIPDITPAARVIGLVDTVLAVGEGPDRRLSGDNNSWKGVRSVLTRDFVPSAYRGRAALIVAASEADAAPAIYALKGLVGPTGSVHTVGFKAKSMPLAEGLIHFDSVQAVQRAARPFVIVNALDASKATLVQPLLRHYSGRSFSAAGGLVPPSATANAAAPNGTTPPNAPPQASADPNSTASGEVSRSRTPQPPLASGTMLAAPQPIPMLAADDEERVYLDLAGESPRGNPLAVAAAQGWTVYSRAEWYSWATVETLKQLSGESIPYDFVKMASGRSMA